MLSVKNAIFLKKTAIGNLKSHELDSKLRHENAISHSLTLTP